MIDHIVLELREIFLEETSARILKPEDIFKKLKPEKRKSPRTARDFVLLCRITACLWLLRRGLVILGIWLAVFLVLHVDKSKLPAVELRLDGGEETAFYNWHWGSTSRQEAIGKDVFQWPSQPDAAVNKFPREPGNSPPGAAELGTPSTIYLAKLNEFSLCRVLLFMGMGFLVMLLLCSRTLRWYSGQLIPEHISLATGAGH
jgi:hypothetical protein